MEINLNKEKILTLVQVICQALLEGARLEFIPSIA